MLGFISFHPTYVFVTVGKLKVLLNKDLRRLSSAKNASSLIVQSSRTLPFAFCLLPLAFCLLPFAFCLLPFASCLTKPTNGLFQEALTIHRLRYWVRVKASTPKSLWTLLAIIPVCACHTAAVAVRLAAEMFSRFD